MTRDVIFLTHADVTIDPSLPVPHWSLNANGAARHAQFALSDVLAGVTSVYSSCEAKAVQGAAPVGARLGLAPKALPALGENDRSATGYLPRKEFEQTANAFFANPDSSVRGWERARAAQARIIATVGTLAMLDATRGDILVVAHGGAGTLLRCWLKDIDITRSEDQPGSNGGNYFTCDLALSRDPGPWHAI